MIEFQNVSKHYRDGREALNNISLSIQPGELVLLAGPSGAGKSTLLKLISLMERPTTGTVIVNGHNLGKMRRSRIPGYRRELGMIFQDFKLLPGRNVFDNVALPLVVAGYTQSEIAPRVHAALEKVGLSGKDKMLPLALSGGEQQRIDIARAIVHRPALLLADEPTGNLDPALALDIMRLLADLNRAGTTLVIATHSIDLIKRLGGRVLILRDGALTQPAATGEEA